MPDANVLVELLNFQRQNRSTSPGPWSWETRAEWEDWSWKSGFDDWSWKSDNSKTSSSGEPCTIFLVSLVGLVYDISSCSVAKRAHW